MEPTNQITGARFIAEMLQGYGVTHVFYVDAILRKTMVELEELGIRRVITHSEKAVAYMADGYARVSFRPGVCMAQSVGAANLASGLQDAFLGLSPVIALTGKKPPLFQHRNAYHRSYAGRVERQVRERPSALPAERRVTGAAVRCRSSRARRCARVSGRACPDGRDLRVRSVRSVYRLRDRGARVSDRVSGPFSAHVV